MLAHTLETLHGDLREKLRLEELKEKYQIVSELARDYIYEAIIDSGKTCPTYASSRFTELTGYTSNKYGKR